MIHRESSLFESLPMRVTTYHMRQQKRSAESIAYDVFLIVAFLIVAYAFFHY